MPRDRDRGAGDTPGAARDDTTVGVKQDAGTDETLVDRPNARRAAVVDASVDEADYPSLRSVESEHYAAGREIARGGMGRISSARDRRLGRRVAIKELLSSDETLAARFEREARITARLQHPNIIHVYEAGRWSSGSPFYAMNLVNGRPLDKVIADATTVAARLALVANVIAAVDALAYAHSEGVIHRDLKPSNVLIGAFGETVVIDWGIAKELGAPDLQPSEPGSRLGSSVETVAGTVLGTPAYMPPEQAAGSAVDATADVYALGAILYHVLAGVPPYTARSSDELLAMVGAAPPRPLVALTPNVPSDLVAIVEKAMARDPADRFPTAKEMAEELKRFQTGQLVTSYRYSTRELIRRWIRRHRGAVAVSALAALVLAIVGAVSLARVIRAEQRARSAQVRAEHRADQVTLAQARGSLATDPTATLGLLAQLSSDPQVWDEARSIAADAASRGVAHVLQAGAGEITGIAFSADGARLASGGEDRVVRVWELSTWTSRELGRIDANALAVAFDGEQVVAVDARGTIWRCDAPRGCARASVSAPGTSLTRAVFAPDGRRVVMFGDAAVLWDTTTASSRPLGSYQQGAWSPDGAVLVVASSTRVDRIELATNAISNLFALESDERKLTAIATNGARLAVALLGDHRVYEVVDGRLVEQHWEHEGPVSRIAYLNGALVSTSSDQEFFEAANPLTRLFRAGDYSIVVWHRHRDFERLVGHRGNIASLALASHGGTIASGDTDGAIRVWRSAGPDRLSDDSYRPASVAAVADRGRAIVAGRSGWPPGARPSFDVIDLASGAVRSLACCDPPPAEARREGTADAGTLRIAASQLVMAADGTRFVVLDSDHTVTAWSLDRTRGHILVDHATAATISRDGRTIATARADGSIETWDAATGSGRPIGRGAGTVTAIACSSDGAMVAIATSDGARIYGRAERALGGAGEPIASLVFSPDAKLLVGGGAGDASAVYVWDLATGTRRVFRGHSAAIRVLAFAPDGASVASGSADKTVRVWRLGDGTATVLRGHVGQIASIGFRDDGRALVTASDDRIAWLWDLPSGHGRALRGHQAVVLVAGFAAGDQRVVSVDRDGAIRFHADVVPPGEAALRVWLAAAAKSVPAIATRPPVPLVPPVAAAPVSCVPGQEDSRGCRDVAAALDGLRWELPCRPHGAGDRCDTLLPRTTKSVALAGAPGAAYDVTLRFRGVVEQQRYVGGTADGLWQVGGKPAQRTFNIYELRTSSPPQVFFLNAGAAELRRAWPLDYQKTIRIAGGATVTLTGDAQDYQQIANQDDKGQPLIIEGVPPAPAPFDGQFIQIDVISVTPARGR